jgi:hypothetical protein
VNELDVVVAAPFRHGRKDRVSKMELVFYYVQDKRWMSLDQAKKLINLATKRGLLIKEGGGSIYHCASSLANVTIPLGFHPSDEIFVETSEEQDPIEVLIDDIATTTGRSKENLAAEMREISEHFDNLLVPEISVILLAKKYGVSSVAYISVLRAEMRERQ